MLWLPVEECFQSSNIKFILHSSTVRARKHKISQSSKTGYNLFFWFIHRCFYMEHAKIIVSLSKNIVLKKQKINSSSNINFVSKFLCLLNNHFVNDQNIEYLVPSTMCIRCPFIDGSVKQGYCEQDFFVGRVHIVELKS